MPARKVYRDYQEGDVGDAFERGHPSTWSDLINLLERDGLADEQLTPGEMAHMIADAKQSSKDNVPFPHGPLQAYRVMKSHRNPELVRQEEQRWIDKTERRQQA
ncbi:MAG: hypothetical protein ACRDIY_00890 [Chloroflexota bacterium]